MKNKGLVLVMILCGVLGGFSAGMGFGAGEQLQDTREKRRVNMEIWDEFRPGSYEATPVARAFDTDTGESVDWILLEDLRIDQFGPLEGMPIHANSYRFVVVPTSKSPFVNNEIMALKDLTRHQIRIEEGGTSLVRSRMITLPNGKVVEDRVP